MGSNYAEDDFLLLSGIQHFAFCERQWALIHLEQIWAENVRTIEGKHLHDRTDDPFFDESRKGLRIIRGMPLVSHRLRLRGVADVVEFQLSPQYVANETCRLQGRDGWWHPVPVEYKRGRPKPDDRDAVQLCAQAMALEEMMHVSIPSGYLYYGDTRRRELIAMDERIRQFTADMAARMHRLAREGCTPKAKHCSHCSLVDHCQPDWMIRHRSVAKYLRKMCDLEGDKS